jgi:hypothetical protein
MQRAIGNIAARLSRRVANFTSGLAAVFHGIREWLYSLLARGRNLERISLDEIRVVGARLRQEPLPRAATNSGPRLPVALTRDARQALKPH